MSEKTDTGAFRNVCRCASMQYRFAPYESYLKNGTSCCSFLSPAVGEYIGRKFFEGQMQNYETYEYFNKLRQACKSDISPPGPIRIERQAL